MSPSSKLAVIVITLFVVLSTVAVGSVGLTGTAVAQSGSVSITNEITSESSSFEVDITALTGTQSGCLRVTNQETGETFEQNSVTEGDRFTVFSEDIGGWEAGDVIEATLYDEPFECFTELGSDRKTVQPVSNFEVTIDSTNSPVVEGETLSTTATVENTGSDTDSQTIDFSIDGTTEDQQSLTLAGGESTQVALSWDTESGDSDTYQANVSSEDDADSTSVIVEEADPPYFDVTIDSTNSPIREGEALSTTATVQNTGDMTGTQAVELRIGGAVEDQQTVTLDGSESTQVTLSWATQSGDAGAYQTDVSSEDDSDSSAVTVEETDPPQFDVTIDLTNAPVLEGETLGVTATVENTGGAADTQPIALRVDGVETDSRTLTLDSGQTETITLDWSTAAGDAGAYAVEVTSDNDTDSTNVTVRTEGDFSIAIDSTNSPVAEGNSLDVTATVRNTGDVSATETVELRLGGQSADSTQLILGSGESQTVTLSWETGSGDAGEYDATVAGDSGADSVAVTVAEPTEVTVSETTTNSPVSEGETVVVTSEVANSGGAPADQSIGLRIGDESVDSVDVSLAADESETVRLNWDPSDTGEYVATVASEDDTDTAAVVVRAGPEFSVDITATNSPVSDGDPLEVTATVTNTGDATGSERISLSAAGSERDSRELTLAPGESETVTVSWVTDGSEPGEYEVEVAGQADSKTTLVRVSESDDSLSPLLWLLPLVLVVLLGGLFYLRRQGSTDADDS